MAQARQAADDAGARPLWFNPPDDRASSRRSLTRQRVVSEALAIISTNGVEALSMRVLATRLGVVPGALYRHVRGREQLHDLILDGVLAEVDREVEPLDRAGHGARPPAPGGPGRPSRHRRTA
jgi:AcrR family transcriptional regulator